MVGYRKTHDYPHGRPPTLYWLDGATLIIVLAWVFLVPGHWIGAIGILAAFVALAIVNTNIQQHYERTGQAVRIS